MADEQTIQLVKQTDLSDAVKAQLDEALGDKLTGLALMSDVEAKMAELPKPKEAEVTDTSAELEAGGALAGIMDMKVMDVPIGQAAVGGFVAVFASEVIDGFLAAQGSMVKGLVKLAGAGVALKWGKGLLGSTGSKAVGLLLAYDGIRMLLPIDTWATRAAGGLSGIIPGGGLGGAKSIVEEASNVARNYAGGRDFYPTVTGRIG